MRLSRSSSAFSLIELLVALSILAVVAAVIVPRFLNVRSQAAATVLAAQLAQLNHTYNQWTSLGGADGGDSGINVLQFLSTPSDGTPSRSAGTLCADSAGNFGSGTVSLTATVDTTTRSNNINVSLPDGFYKNAAGGAAPSGSNPSPLYFKSNGTVYPLAYTSGTGFSQDLGGTNGSL